MFFIQSHTTAINWEFVKWLWRKQQRWPFGKDRKLREISAENSTAQAVDVAINDFYNFVQSSNGFKKDWCSIFLGLLFFYFNKKCILVYIPIIILPLERFSNWAPYYPSDIRCSRTSVFIRRACNWIAQKPDRTSFIKPKTFYSFE